MTHFSFSLIVCWPHWTNVPKESNEVIVCRELHYLIFLSTKGQWSVAEIILTDVTVSQIVVILAVLFSSLGEKPLAAKACNVWGCVSHCLCRTVFLTCFVMSSSQRLCNISAFNRIVKSSQLTVSSDYVTETIILKSPLWVRLGLLEKVA